MYEDFMKNTMLDTAMAGERIVLNNRMSVVRIDSHSLTSVVDRLTTRWGRPKLLVLSAADERTPTEARWHNTDGHVRAYTVNGVPHLQRCRTNASSREVNISANLLEAARARRTCNFKSVTGTQLRYDGRAASENGGRVQVPVFADEQQIGVIDADTSMRKPLNILVDTNLGAHSFVIFNTHMKPALEYLINVY